MVISHHSVAFYLLWFCDIIKKQNSPVFMAKKVNRNNLKLVVFNLTTIFSFVLISSCNKTKEFDNDDVVVPIEETKQVLQIHTDRQSAYLRDKVDKVNDYAVGEKEYSRPSQHKYTWKGGRSPYTVYLSEKSNYSNALIYESSENEIILTNLKVKSNYYLKVISNNEVIKEDAFTTEDTIIRNMYVSGVTNVRDLGGYYIGDKVSKQGLIYRTGRLNECGTESITDKITEKGKLTMLNEMKVKTEIDLRLVENNEVGKLTEGTGVLGGGVSYYQCPMNYEVSFDEEINVKALRKVFEILGNSANYPLFFHCSIGTDRTGYIAWLINGCLGLDEDTLYRDYLFSNFGDIGGKRTNDDIKNKYVRDIKNTSGGTLKEKTVNYLLNKGVKQGQIDTLYSIML